MENIENTYLNTKILGKKIFYINKIDSTQKEIWRKIEKENIENGTIIIADIQTAGIGTHGIIWHTDEQNNIAFSLFIETNCLVENIKGITLKIAEILVKTLNELYNINLDIKAPNDLTLNEKKIVGLVGLCVNRYYP